VVSSRVATSASGTDRVTSSRLLFAHESARAILAAGRRQSTSTLNDLAGEVPCARASMDR
jgi:hypothetical protein